MIRYMQMSPAWRCTLTRNKHPLKLVFQKYRGMVRFDVGCRCRQNPLLTERMWIQQTFDQRERASGRSFENLLWACTGRPAIDDKEFMSVTSIKLQCANAMTPPNPKRKCNETRSSRLYERRFGHGIV